MGIDTGFKNYGFVDDREEQEMWNGINEQLSDKTEPTSATDEDIEGKIDIDEAPEWTVDMSTRSVQTHKKQKASKKQGFFHRNKREIFDALIVLGVIYVGYKLFFEKDGNQIDDFADGGSVDYTPTPQVAPQPQPQPVQAPPRPEMPEPTYNGE